MKIIRKRGQAALEFLTTYGWAFLVILIMIAALAYFGVLNPANFLPERCNLPAEFQCDEFVINQDSANGQLDVQLVIRNQVGKAVTLQGFNYTSDSTAITGTTCVTAFPTSAIGSGDTVTIECSADMAAGALPPRGEKFRLAYDLTYRESTGQFDHTVGGEIYGTIQ